MGRLAALSVALWLGCSDAHDAPDAATDAATEDAGSDAAAEVFEGPEAPASPEAPAAPADASLPVLTPCPAGWRPVEFDPVVCEPWPEAGRATCGADEAHFPGEPACARVGRACDGEDWPAELPAEGVVYVRAGADPGGDGAVERPLSTIAEALAAAPAGSIVALARGRYEEAVTIVADVTIRGACAAETVLAPIDPHDTEAAIRIQSGAVTLSDLGIRGERPGLAVGGAETSLDLEGVVIDGVVSYGVIADSGATVQARRLVVRNVRGRPSDGGFGRGLEVRTGAHVEIAAAAIEETLQFGVLVWDVGSSLELADSAIVDIHGDVGGFLGMGAIAGAGGALVLERTAIERTCFGAIIAGERGTTVDLADVVLRDVEAQPADGMVGRGIDIEVGARLTAERVLVERSREGGIVISTADAVVGDVVIRNTREQASDSLGGMGFIAQQGGIADVHRLFLTQNLRTGVLLRDPGSLLRGSDVVITDTLSNPAEVDMGRGIEAGAQAALDLERVRIERSVDGAVVLVDAAAVTLSDLAVTTTTGSPAIGESGRGLAVWESGPVSVTRARLADNTDAAIIAVGAVTEVALEDVTVVDTRSRDSDLMWGRALSAQGGAHVTVARGSFERNHEVGVVATEATTVVELADVTVRETLPRPLDGLLGVGLVVQGGAILRVERGVVEQSAVGGLLAEAGGLLEVADLVVRDTISDPDDQFGRGMLAQGGGRIEGSRVLLEGNHEASITAAQPGSVVILQDVEIVGTLPRPCADDTCEGAGAGSGATAVLSGAITLRRFRVAQNALCGVQIARDGQMDLEVGIIEDNPVGANVQVPEFDLSRLTHDVVYRDNERNFDGSALPVPAGESP